MTGDAATRQTIREAVAVLARGGLVAFPTETVYGLGADASNETAVRRIFTVKGRPADHPLIVHLARVEQLRDWARRVPEAAWPRCNHSRERPVLLTDFSGSCVRGRRAARR